MARYWPLLLSLAAIWGASYLFIKVAVEDIEPTPMMSFRALVAGVMLLAYLLVVLGARPALGALRTHWRPSLVLGAINAALPFWLVAWGEQYIDSSVAGIAQATVPLFSFLVATRFLPHEHVGPARIAGVAMGFLGVAVLAGFDPRGGWWAVAGVLAVVVSSLSYASAGAYGQLRVATVPGPVLATGSMLAGGLILLPFAMFELPSERPDAEAIGSLLALTVLGTAFAQLVLFRILRLYGARRFSLVTYLMPAFAIVYGAILLDEPLTAAALGGFALILTGVALASGARFARGRTAAARSEPA
jgi:drug/metabolite transporter (DMT)-like permease